MTNKPLSKLAEDRQQLIEAISQCTSAVGSISAADGKYPDFNSEIEEIGFSIGTLHARAELLATLLTDLVAATQIEPSALPIERIVRLMTSLREVTKKLMEIVGDITDFGDFASGDERGLVYANTDNSKSLNLHAEYTSLASLLDTALANAYEVRALVQTASIPDFSEAVSRLGETLGRLSELEFAGKSTIERLSVTEKRLEETTNSVEAQSKLASEHSATAEVKLREIEALAEKLQVVSKRTEGLNASLVQQFGEFHSSASIIRSEIEGYQKLFTSFDAQLEKGQAQLKSISESVEEVRIELEKKHAFADKVIRDAKEALGWGTVQSLTQSFSTSAEELASPVKWATRQVYVSFLLLAAWVLFVFVLPPRLAPSLQLFVVPDKAEGWATIFYVFANLGIRLTIASPAIFFVLFSLNRYRNLFELRQQYIFKKTVASAIPGFKEQAAAQDDAHSKAMTLAAFERLLFNPSEIATRDFGGHNGGNWLSRRLVTLVRQAMDDARK